MQAIGSREYKLMLKAARFEGDEAALNKAAATLWSDLAAIVVPHSVALSGTDDIARRRRQVRFLDTADRWLRSRDYVLRERIDLDEDERQITLKFRHPDRYISQDRDMMPAKGHEPDIKFEEDIKPPFTAVFSFSSDVLVPKDHELASLTDAAALYPGLPEDAGEFPEDSSLVVVGDFTAFERVLKGTSFQIRKDPEVLAECSLTLWYGAESDPRPRVAEFSFKYEDADEGYTAKMSRRAFDAFAAIQSKAGDWIDGASMTKTAYAYALEP
jgi:hypothetical protein